jgi:para-nitrobenzyl esterase
MNRTSRDRSRRRTPDATPQPRRLLAGALVRVLPCVLLALLALSARGAESAAATLAVETAAGRLQGVVHEGRARAWFAIPYAEPPTGALRWQPPRPPAAWSGVRTAAVAGAPCVQPASDAMTGAQLKGSEDCLLLNVYAPLARAAQPLPVVMWIHGGANLFGTGAEFDGSYLARAHDLVVVTINYRLGPLGWFHHPALIEAMAGGPKTGQLALLDAIAALRWVRANAAAFGGDPANVTIAGESAGGQNVYALVLARAAAGLFGKAIAESGGFWNMSQAQAVNYHDAAEPGTPASAREIVSRWLIADGKAKDDAAARVIQSTWPAARLRAWLHGLPLQAIFDPYLHLAHVDYDMPMVVYGDGLLPAGDHRTLLAAGDYNAVPMIIGGNRDEQKLYLQGDPTLVRRVDGHYTILDPRRFAALNRFYSDWWNFMDTDDLAPRLAKPVYAYRFDFDLSPPEAPEVGRIFGAAHGLEVDFVSGDLHAGRGNPLIAASNRKSWTQVSAEMMSYWAAFAYRGDPGRGMDGALPPWSAWQVAHEKLIIGAGAPHMARAAVDGARLLEALAASPDLGHDDKCAVYRDNTMFPSYPLARLKALGCRLP